MHGSYLCNMHATYSCVEEGNAQLMFCSNFSAVDACMAMCGRLTNSSRIYFLFPVGKVSSMEDPEAVNMCVPNGRAPNFYFGFQSCV